MIAGAPGLPIPLLREHPHLQDSIIVTDADTASGPFLPNGGNHRPALLNRDSAISVIVTNRYRIMA
jgi:hypothetical protein